MKPIAYYQGREQTYIKHLFLERYLETVAYHIGYSNSEFYFVDCFSGPWRASDEELGDTSVRIALEILNRVLQGLSAQRRRVSIHAIFVEKSSSAFGTLQEVLDEHRGNVQTLALQGSFEDNIPSILGHVGSRFAFFFVDPTGWTGFAMAKLRPILERRRGEVMINLMYDFVNRFLSFDTAGDSLDQLFGVGDWRSIRDSSEREQELVELYVQQVRKTGNFDYATCTRILKPLHERAYFHLVYATRNVKGIEEFREVERRVSPRQDVIRQQTQRDHRETKSGQAEFIFPDGPPSKSLQLDRASQLRRAEEAINSLLSERPYRYGDLRGRVLQLPLVWKSDVSDIVLKESRSGRYRIEGLGPRERVPKENCVIHLVH